MTLMMVVEDFPTLQFFYVERCWPPGHTPGRDAFARWSWDLIWRQQSWEAQMQGLMKFNVLYFWWWNHGFTHLTLISILVHGVTCWIFHFSSQSHVFSGANCESFLSNARSVHLRRVWKLFLCVFSGSSGKLNIYAGRRLQGQSFFHEYPEDPTMIGNDWKILEWRLCRDGKASWRCCLFLRGHYETMSLCESRSQCDIQISRGRRANMVQVPAPLQTDLFNRIRL